MIITITILVTIAGCEKRFRVKVKSDIVSKLDLSERIHFVDLKSRIKLFKITAYKILIDNLVRK